MKKTRRTIISILMLLVMCFSTLTACLDDWDEEEEQSTEKTSSNKKRHDDDDDDDERHSSGTTSKRRNSMANVEGVRSPQVKLKGNGEDTVTIMMYVNGSNLETDDNEATTDLSEVIKGAGTSDKVNIVVQTMGTKKWSTKLGISSKETERYKLDGNGLTKVSSGLGQLDCTKESTLSDFIKWSAANYPADRYILMFWDHGGGSVYGFGYDEWVSDEEATLTIDEIQSALNSAGVYFDFIGMDCCIMATLETACAFYDYADYAILCEDFESGLGWYYTNWINAIYENTSVATTKLGEIICDDMIGANEQNSSWGDDAIMAVFDLGTIKVLYQAWVEFAYANEDTLLNKNYSRAMTPKKGGRLHPLLSTIKSSYGEEEYSLEDYYEVDIMAAASSIDSDESEALKAAVSGTLVYVTATAGDAHLTGVAVTLPYGSYNDYELITEIFTNIGLDEDYVDWLGKFIDAEGASSYYNYSSFDDDWDGWDYYDDDYDWDDWDCSTGSCGFSSWDYEDSYNYYYDDDDDDWYYYWSDYDDWYYDWDDDDDYYYYWDDDDWDDDDWYYNDDYDYGWDDDDWYDDDDDWYYDDDDDWYYDDDDDWYYDDDDDWDDWDDWDDDWD